MSTAPPTVAGSRESDRPAEGSADERTAPSPNMQTGSRPGLFLFLKHSGIEMKWLPGVGLQEFHVGEAEGVAGSSVSCTRSSLWSKDPGMAGTCQVVYFCILCCPSWNSGPTMEE
jgi:hypothetical protein